MGGPAGKPPPPTGGMTAGAFPPAGNILPMPPMGATGAMPPAYGALTTGGSNMQPSPMVMPLAAAPQTIMMPAGGAGTTMPAQYVVPAVPSPMPMPPSGVLPMQPVMPEAMNQGYGPQASGYVPMNIQSQWLPSTSVGVGSAKGNHYNTGPPTPGKSRKMSGGNGSNGGSINGGSGGGAAATTPASARSTHALASAPATVPLPGQGEGSSAASAAAVPTALGSSS